MNRKRKRATNMPAIARFDGAAAWRCLSAKEQAMVGALALDLGVASIGNDMLMEAAGEEITPALRALGASYQVAVHDIEAVVMNCCGIAEDAAPPVPLVVGQVCRVCGCTQDDSCDEGCEWVADDLCSACR